MSFKHFFFILQTLAIFQTKVHSGYTQTQPELSGLIPLTERKFFQKKLEIKSSFVLRACMLLVCHRIKGAVKRAEYFLILGRSKIAWTK